MKKIKKSKIALIILLLIIGIFLTAYIAFRTAYNQNIHTDFKTVDNTGKLLPGSSHRTNILVLGMEGTRTDMIMVATFDPKQKKLDFISIPRDTYVDNEYKDPTFKKINSVYEIPSTKGGVERLAAVISRYLAIPIHEYVMVDYDAVSALTDAVGGVDVNIPFHMYYDDPYSKPTPLHIHFNPGITHLNGQNAVGYLRWRHNNDNTHSAEGDVGRVRRQQDFMKKVLEKSLTANNLPKVAEAVLKNVKTSLEFEQAMSLAKSASSMNPDDIHFYQEVGTPSYFNNLWYFVADKEQTQKLVSKILDGTAISDDDLNPTKDFENYAANLDRSSRQNTQRRYKTTDIDQDHTVKPKKNRISVEDTKLNENEDTHKNSPIFTEEEIKQNQEEQQTETNTNDRQNTGEKEIQQNQNKNEIQNTQNRQNINTENNQNTNNNQIQNQNTTNTENTNNTPAPQPAPKPETQPAPQPAPQPEIQPETQPSEASPIF